LGDVARWGVRSGKPAVAAVKPSVRVAFKALRRKLGKADLLSRGELMQSAVIALEMSEGVGVDTALRQTLPGCYFW